MTNNFLMIMPVKRNIPCVTAIFDSKRKKWKNRNHSLFYKSTHHDQLHKQRRIADQNENKQWLHTEISAIVTIYENQA